MRAKTHTLRERLSVRVCVCVARWLCLFSQSQWRLGVNFCMPWPLWVFVCLSVLYTATYRVSRRAYKCVCVYVPQLCVCVCVESTFQFVKRTWKHAFHSLPLFVSFFFAHERILLQLFTYLVKKSGKAKATQCATQHNNKTENEKRKT